MNHKIQLLIFALFLVSLSACANSQASTEGRETVVFNDGHGNGIDKNEVVITETDLKGINRRIAPAGENLHNTTVSGQDNSEITTMYDSLGNKTETRHFKGHSRLRSVIITTSVDGRKQILIYGFGTDVKTLSDETVNNLMTDSGDEIANAAGIYQTHSNKNSTNFMKPAKSLQPLPSSAFPKPIPQNPPQPEEIEQSRESQKNNSPDQSQEPAAKYNQPDEEKQIF